MTVHSIEELIKWVRHDEWRGAFEDVFQRHIGQACRGAGIELDELAKIVGNYGVSNLSGCVFEDFVSSGPDEQNVAIDYLIA